jgi:hypothetical protein
VEVNVSVAGNSGSPPGFPSSAPKTQGQIVIPIPWSAATGFARIRAPLPVAASARVRACVTAVALAAFASACSLDFPSSAPQWETRWVVPADSTTVSVASLLPANVSVSPDGNAFVLSLDPVGVTRTLGELCSDCALANGLVVPKPAFTDSVSFSIALPTDVSSVALAGGTINLSLTHNFNFDPIRPSATERGSITIRIVHGSTQLAQTVIDGTVESFATSTQKNRTLVLAPASITGPITARVIIVSPAGDAITMDASRSFTATATPTDIRVSQATVRVQDKALSGTEMELDVEGIDESVANRVKSGGFRFTVNNPFTAEGTLSATISAPGITPIVKTMNIPTGVSNAVIQYTGDELRSFLGQPDVILTIGGSVTSTTGGFVTITPGQAISIVSKLDMIITTEEQGGSN